MHENRWHAVLPRTELADLLMGFSKVDSAGPAGRQPQVTGIDLADRLAHPMGIPGLAVTNNRPRRKPNDPAQQPAGPSQLRTSASNHAPPVCRGARLGAQWPLTGAKPCPPTGSVTVLWSNLAINGLPLVIASRHTSLTQTVVASDGSLATT